jgi:hypothetical protein
LRASYIEAPDLFERIDQIFDEIIAVEGELDCGELECVDDVESIEIQSE